MPASSQELGVVEDIAVVGGIAAATLLIGTAISLWAVHKATKSAVKKAIPYAKAGIRYAEAHPEQVKAAAQLLPLLL